MFKAPPKVTSWPQVCIGCTNAKPDELEHFPQGFQKPSRYGAIQIPASLFLCKDCRSNAEALSIQEKSRWDKMFKRLGIATAITSIFYILVIMIIRTLATSSPILIHIIFTMFLVVPSFIGAVLSANKIRKEIETVQVETPFLKFIDFIDGGFGTVYHIANEEFHEIFKRLNPSQKTKLVGEPLKPSLNKNGGAFAGFFCCGLMIYFVILLFVVIVPLMF